MSSSRTLPNSLFSGRKIQVNLSDLQRDVLAAIQIDGDCSPKQIAKSAQVSEARVRRALTKLIDDGVVHRRFVINPYALGFTMYGILLRLSGKIYEQRDDLISFLVASPKVSYVGEIGGASALRIGLVTRSQSENTAFFDGLIEKFGPLIEEKNVFTVQGLIDYPLQCLGTSSHGRSLPISSHTPVYETDDVDIQIVRELAEIGNRNLSQIARKISIPATTAEYRISRLTERGIIVGSRYLIDISKFGFSSFVQFVKIRGCGKKARALMREFCHRHPNVYYSVHFDGTWDFEIGTMVENASDIVGVTNGLYAAYKEQLLALDTLPLLRYYKVSSFP